MLASLQLALTTIVIAYLGQWRHSQVKRNRRTWREVVSTLQVRASGLRDVHSLREIFRSAPLLVQIADYAEYNGHPDDSLLQELRGDAFTIRLFALSALAKHLLGRTNTAT